MKRSRLKHALAFIVVAGVVVLLTSLHLYHTYSLQSSISRYKLLNDYSTDDGIAGRTKVAVFWTKFFDVPNWGMQKATYTEGDLKAIGCSTTNCVFTHNKQHLTNPHEYDAIIFHGAEMWTFVDLPATRSPHQVYVMMSKESPGEVKHDLKLDHDFYNLTMTYRLDSDIPLFYGTTTDLESGAAVAPALNVQWREPDNEYNDKRTLTLVAGKTKTAAWFVSHCNALSQRDELVKRLQKFITVDVYGKCGSLSCPHYSSHCDEMLNSTYKFYFAFENTLCIDYLTEKLFNVMNKFIIPVVYSGADMKNFLPPKSYIDANDFETVEDLARHLNFLSRTPHEYVKYFWWRKHYKIVPVSDTPRIICEMCEKLNEPNFRQKRQTYVDMIGWFYKGACGKPKIRF